MSLKPKIKSNSGSSKTFKIAICGTRGIPACYGGFETFAEELSARLSAMGHEVRVYGRSHVIDYSGTHYRGAEIRLLSAPKHKYFETPVHTFKSFLDLLSSPVDIVLVCNGANSPFIWIPRFLGRMPVVVNVDGIERMRGKWNLAGRLWYRLGEICSVVLASQLVSDAEVIRDYYLKSYKRDSVVLRYGCKPLFGPLLRKKLENSSISSSELSDSEVFKELGLVPGKYLLYVSRLEPENNAHRVIESYNALPKEKKLLPLVIVGDAPYADEYKSMLREIAGENVIFAGFRFGNSYESLQTAAYLYIQATEVGGTHPALVESMGFANCVICNGTPENVEVLGGAGLSYQKNSNASLTSALSRLISNPDQVCSLRRAAHERALEEFSWDRVSLDYSRLFHKMLGYEQLEGRQDELPKRRIQGL